MTEGEALALQGLKEFASVEAGKQLARRVYARMLPLVSEEARKLGFTFEATTPGATEALKLALGSYREAWHAMLAKGSAKPARMRDATGGSSRGPT